jgi:nitrogen regulatory protein P-II 1
MKEVKAIVLPFMLTKVVDALKNIEGLPGLTVDSDVRGFGRSRAAQAYHKIAEDTIEYAPMAKLEIVVHDKLVESVIQTIQSVAYTGNVGDGKIYLFPIEEGVKIRSNERGQKAL